MSTRYNATDYSPPAPVLPVAFRYTERPWLGPFEAIADTGADATIIPESIAQRLRATPLNPGRLETQWGDIHPVTIYLLDIQVSGQSLPGIVVAGDPETDEIVLGRNVLNTLPLLLDGPEQQTDVLDDSTMKRLRARH
jgi:predicted aspartyl protease